VQPEAARAAVLASFACVDLACLFEEDSPEALIEALRPDVLIKGANHAREDVIGADHVRSWGGRVLLIDLLAEQLPQPGLASLKT
jgi:D-beta-D-heptose 7-phosphate kinase/D-beta-D-heptose 1-phosphate adenosyltransferase